MAPARMVRRPATVPLIVAYLTAHREESSQDISGFVGENPFTYLLASLIILAFGPGRAAMHIYITKRRPKTPDKS